MGEDSGPVDRLFLQPTDINHNLPASVLDEMQACADLAKAMRLAAGSDISARPRLVPIATHVSSDGESNGLVLHVVPPDEDGSCSIGRIRDIDPDETSDPVRIY